MTITDECINCGACSDECEHNSIYNAGETYEFEGQTLGPLSEDHTYIAPELCNTCGSCKEVCAVDAIIE